MRIIDNHRRYIAMHRLLQESPGAIRTHFFAAAACVTHPAGGLGVLERPWGRLLFTGDEAALLVAIHRALATLNTGWFERLCRGMEVPGCEGLRGAALDHALVVLEQARFTRVMEACLGDDTARRQRLVTGLNATLRAHPLMRSPFLEAPLRAALASARACARLDLADEPQRCRMGHAIVDMIRDDARATGRNGACSRTANARRPTSHLTKLRHPTMRALSVPFLMIPALALYGCHPGGEPSVQGMPSSAATAVTAGSAPVSSGEVAAEASASAAQAATNANTASTAVAAQAASAPASSASSRP